MQVSYPAHYIAYDDPAVNQYYASGEYECPSECHICMTAWNAITNLGAHGLGNNTCMNEVDYETVLLDADTIRDNRVADLQTEHQ